MPTFEKNDAEITVLAAKTANYTLELSDFASEVLFDIATNQTLTLLPVADAKNGFNFIARNIGSGVLGITVPDSASLDTNSLSQDEFVWLRSDGTNWKTLSKRSSGGLRSIQTFTANGTWTKPAGINFLKITVVGGGGGGGSNAAGSGAGSGGAGGTAIKWMDASSVTATVAVTIGAGGAGAPVGAGNNGSSGGTSSFGIYCSATGGNYGFGSSGSGGLAGWGGAGSGGDLNLSGGGGGPGGIPNNSGICGGPGGASYLGGGNRGIWNSSGGAATGAPGGGGAGAAANATGSGGSGGDGIVFIEEYA